MLAPHTEEILPSHALAFKLSVIILEKGKENFIAHFGAQVFKETYTRQINLVPIGPLTATIINGRIHITRFLKLEVAIVPPPLHHIWVNGFIIDALTIR